MTTAKPIVQPSAAPAVPERLVKEVLDGIPVYYKGYREVLANQKQSEEIMADGLLQAIIKSWIARLLIQGLDDSKYWMGIGEVGSHISRRVNLSHDAVIFEKSKLPASKISNQYADVPAKVVLEIDTEVEYGNGLPEQTYVHRKTQRVLDFGTEKVIWIFTASRKVMVAERGKDWVTCDWDRDIEVLDGVVFNVAQHLNQTGILLAGPDTDEPL